MEFGNEVEFFPRENVTTEMAVVGSFTVSPTIGVDVTIRIGVARWSTKAKATNNPVWSESGVSFERLQVRNVLSDLFIA